MIKQRRAVKKTRETASYYGVFDENDMKKTRYLCAFAYLIFFLPLVISPRSNYARFHANQGFVLTAAFMLSTLLAIIIPAIGHYIVSALTLAYICLIIYGVNNALSMRIRTLPLLGRIKLIRVKEVEELY